MTKKSTSGLGSGRNRALLAGAVVAGSMVAAVSMAPLAGALCAGPGPENEGHRGGCVLPIPPEPAPEPSEIAPPAN